MRSNQFRVAIVVFLFVIGCVVPQSQIKKDKPDDFEKNKSFDYYYKKGNKELDNGNFEKAIAMLTKGINIDDSVPGIFLSRGIAYFEDNEYEKSSADLLRVIELEQGNKAVLKWMGKIQFLRGNFDKAFDNFNKLDSRELRDKEDIEWYNMIRDSVYKFHLDEAENSRTKGDYSRAKQELEICRSIKPEEAEPICRLSDIYISEREPWFSCRLLESFKEDVQQPCLIYFKALTNYILAQSDEAIELLYTLKENSNDTQITDNLLERFQKEENGEIINFFKEISFENSITRSELAFLISIRLVPHISLSSKESIVVTDIADTQMEKYIYLVLNMDLMSAFPNHTFKPNKMIKRRDFVIYIDHLMQKFGITPEKHINDIPIRECDDLHSESLYFNAAQNLLRMELISLYPDKSFRGEKNITGQEAINCFEKLKDILMHYTSSHP